MQSPIYIGIDVGTSKIKVCLFDHGGVLIKQVIEDSVIMKSDDAYVELDAMNLFDTLIALVRIASRGYESEIVSISFSVTSPTVVFLDEELKPLLPAIVYLDNRSTDIVSRYVDKIGGRDEYFRRTGNNPSSSTCSAALIEWVRENRPEVWGNVRCFAYLNSFLAAKFTGNLVADPTVASYSGIVDIRTPMEWDESLLEAFGVDGLLLPPLVNPYDMMGKLTPEMALTMGLNQNVVVAVGSADTAASSFGLGITRQGDVFESLGTSGVFTVCLDEPTFDKAFMNRSHVIPGLWLAHGAMSTTGAAINWLINDVFSELSSVEQIEQEAWTSMPGSNGVVFLPYLAGERSPVFDSNTSGVFFGLGLKTRRADLVRAVYESSAYGMYQLYTIAREKWGIGPRNIKCVGGASNSELALGIRADLFGLPFNTVQAPNSSAFGAAMLGAIASGHHTFESVPTCSTITHEVVPVGANHAQYLCNYDIYKELYPALSKLMHKDKVCLELSR